MAMNEHPQDPSPDAEQGVPLHGTPEVPPEAPPPTRAQTPPASGGRASVLAVMAS
jgi:hypothetical protein